MSDSNKVDMITHLSNADGKPLCGFKPDLLGRIPWLIPNEVTWDVFKVNCAGCLIALPIRIPPKPSDPVYHKYTPTGPLCGVSEGLSTDNDSVVNCFDCVKLVMRVVAKKSLNLSNRPGEVINDPVNHPSHYTSYKGLEVIDLTEQMNFNKGNAVKYICRAGLKPGVDETEDLKKAIWYLNRELERINADG
jgi:Protein of unknwon function (DUF3310)